MQKEDIQLAREEIAKATENGPYGPGMPMPFALLRDAIETIERQRHVIDQIASVATPVRAQQIAREYLRSLGA